jgi:tetratricopeptide (TPR) repeat protein
MNRRTVLRNVLGAALFVSGMLVTRGSGVGGMLLGFAAAISGAILLSPTLTPLLSRPFTGFIDLIYFGSNQTGPPEITLRLAQAYRKAGRHEDAIAECERQLEWHPRSLELWRELVRNAREITGSSLAVESFRRAAKRLQAKDLATLQTEFPSLAATAG